MQNVCVILCHRWRGSCDACVGAIEVVGAWVACRVIRRLRRRWGVESKRWIGRGAHVFKTIGDRDWSRGCNGAHCAIASSCENEFLNYNNCIRLTSYRKGQGAYLITLLITLSF